MTREDVTGRSRLARYLPYRIFPADRGRLLVSAAEHHAPDELVVELRGLPKEASYRTVTDVWEALGHGREDDTHRA